MAAAEARADGIVLACAMHFMNLETAIAIYHRGPEARRRAATQLPLTNFQLLIPNSNRHWELKIENWQLGPFYGTGLGFLK